MSRLILPSRELVLPRKRGICDVVGHVVQVGRASGGPPTYTYYRLTGTTKIGAGNGGVYDWKIFDETGTNILTGGTPSSPMLGSPANAFDGNVATQTGTAAYPWHIQYQTPSPKTPHYFSVAMTNSSAWKIECSADGSTWDLVASYSGDNQTTSTVNVYYRPLYGVEAWKLQITATTTGSNILALRDIAIASSAGGANLLTGGFAGVSSGNGNPAVLFDGTTTFLQNDGTNNPLATSPYWQIIYTLPVGTSIASPYELRITPYTSGVYPKDFSLYKASTYTAGVPDWTLVRSWTNVTSGWSSGTMRTFTI